MKNPKNLLEKIKPVSAEKQSDIVKEAARASIRDIYPNFKVSEEMLDNIVDRMRKNASISVGEGILGGEYLSKKVQAILRLIRQKKVVPNAASKLKSVFKGTSSKAVDRLKGVARKIPEDIKELGRAMRAPRNTIADLPASPAPRDLWGEHIRKNVKIIRGKAPEVPVQRENLKDTLERLNLLKYEPAPSPAKAKSIEDFLPKTTETIKRTTPKSSKSVNFSKLETKSFNGKRFASSPEGKAIDIPAPIEVKPVSKPKNPKKPKSTSTPQQAPNSSFTYSASNPPADPVNTGNAAAAFSALGLSPREMMEAASNETKRIQRNEQLRAAMRQFLPRKAA